MGADLRDGVRLGDPRLPPVRRDVAVHHHVAVGVWMAGSRQHGCTFEDAVAVQLLRLLAWAAWKGLDFVVIPGPSWLRAQPMSLGELATQT